MLTNPPPFGSFENGSPRGDETRHIPEDELLEGFRSLPPAPTERGTLRFLCVRRPDGVRERPESVRLSVEDGVEGDRWAPGGEAGVDNQITVCRHDVAVLSANGQDLALFGDNLMVDLDLSTRNLPHGSRLRVGETLLEVTPEPHNGCAKFKQRFGMGALRLTARKDLRDQHLRGIHVKVIEGGTVRIGDEVVVVWR